MEVYKEVEVFTDLEIFGTLAPGQTEDPTANFTVLGNLSIAEDAYLMLDIASDTDADHIQVNGDIVIQGNIVSELHSSFSTDEQGVIDLTLIEWTGSQSGSIQTETLPNSTASSDLGASDYSISFAQNEFALSSTVRNGLEQVDLKLSELISYFDIDQIDYDSQGLERPDQVNISTWVGISYLSWTQSGVIMD